MWGWIGKGNSSIYLAKMISKKSIYRQSYSLPYKEGVAGSNPASRTIFFTVLGLSDRRKIREIVGEVGNLPISRITPKSCLFISKFH